MEKFSARLCRKSLRKIVSTSSGSVATTVAERGWSSRSAISPKNSPGPSIERMISLPSGEIIVTFTAPLWIRQNTSPGSEAWNTTSSLAYLRGFATAASEVSSLSSSSAKRVNLRNNSICMTVSAILTRIGLGPLFLEEKTDRGTGNRPEDFQRVLDRFVVAGRNAVDKPEVDGGHDDFEGSAACAHDHLVLIVESVRLSLN